MPDGGGSPTPPSRAEGAEVEGGASALDHESVRTSYDAVAARYAERFDEELAYKPLDRSLLAVLLEETAAPGVIADLGCGPGHVAAWLVEHGGRAVGVDLSPAMVAEAHRRHPGIEYRVGDLVSLPAIDGEFAAAVAMYSLIHLGEDELPGALSEMRRVLRPGGLLLLSFHVGIGARHLDEWFGQAVDVDFRFLEVAGVEAALVAAGFLLEARLERSPYPEETDTRRAYLLARA